MATSTQLLAAEALLDETWPEGLLGDRLLTSQGTLPTLQALDESRIVLLYFGASWCPSCSVFTARLGAAFSALPSSSLSGQVVYVSVHEDEESFTEYFGTMPWLALPFKSPKIQNLFHFFSVTGIPRLVALDARSGCTLELKARDVLRRNNFDLLACCRIWGLSVPAGSAPPHKPKPSKRPLLVKSKTPKGWKKIHGARCATRTVSVAKSGAGSDFFEECRKACDAMGANSFQIENGQCRVPISASRKTRKGKAVVYVRQVSIQLPDSVAEESELPAVSKLGAKVDKEGDPYAYFEFKGGEWTEQTCTTGLVFDAARHECVLEKPEHHFQELWSGKQAFLLAGQDTSAVQTYIRLEMDAWWREVQQHPDIRQHPAGEASVKILNTCSIEVASKLDDDNVTTSRWATFTEDGDEGELAMQAVALVEQSGSQVQIMGIVSRHSLLQDSLSKRGSGQVLLSGILDAVHDEFPDQTISLIGTPGDRFVEALYKNHGMVEYARGETGMPKLRIDFPSHCVPFVTDGILRRNMPPSSYAAIMWRLIPGSWYLKRTCAHVIPASLYWKQIGNMLCSCQGICMVAAIAAAFIVPYKLKFSRLS